MTTKATDPKKISAAARPPQASARLKEVPKPKSPPAAKPGSPANLPANPVAGGQVNLALPPERGRPQHMPANGKVHDWSTALGLPKESERVPMITIRREEYDDLRELEDLCQTEKIDKARLRGIIERKDKLLAKMSQRDVGSTDPTVYQVEVCSNCGSRHTGECLG
jgi:hypothetical protein